MEMTFQINYRMPDQESAQDISQAVSFRPGKVWQTKNMPTRKQKRFKRPNCPERQDYQPIVILLHDAAPMAQLCLGNIQKQSGPMF